MLWKILVGVVITALILLAILEFIVVGAAVLAIGGVIILAVAIGSILTRMKKKKASLSVRSHSRS